MPKYEYQKHLKPEFIALDAELAAGNFDKIKELINQENINTQLDSYVKNTPLHVATLHAQPEIVSYLLDQKSNIEAMYQEKYTALYDAVSFYKTRVARSEASSETYRNIALLLIQKGAAITEVIKTDLLPKLDSKDKLRLYIESQNKKIATLAALEKNTIDKNPIDKKDSEKKAQDILPHQEKLKPEFADLDKAFASGDLAKVKSLINADNINTPIDTGLNATPVFAAVLHAQPDIVNYLLEQKANVNAEVKQSGNVYTLLSEATVNHGRNKNDKGAAYLKIALMLIEHGVDFSCEKAKQATASLTTGNNLKVILESLVKLKEGTKEIGYETKLARAYSALGDQKKQRQWFLAGIERNSRMSMWEYSVILITEKNISEAIKLLAKSYLLWATDTDRSDVINKLTGFTTSAETTEKDKLEAYLALSEIYIVDGYWYSTAKAYYDKAQEINKKGKFTLPVAQQKLLQALEFIDNPHDQDLPCKNRANGEIDIAHYIQCVHALVDANRSGSGAAWYWLLYYARNSGSLDLQIPAMFWSQVTSKNGEEFAKKLESKKYWFREEVVRHGEIFEGYKALHGWYRTENCLEAIKTFERVIKSEQNNKKQVAALAYLYCLQAHTRIVLANSDAAFRSERISRVLLVCKDFRELLLKLDHFPRKEIYTQLFLLLDAASLETDKIAVVKTIFDFYTTEILFQEPSQALLKEIFTKFITNSDYSSNLEFFKLSLTALVEGYQNTKSEEIKKILLEQMKDLAKRAEKQDLKFKVYVNKALAECFSHATDKEVLKNALQYFEAAREFAKLAEEKYDDSSYIATCKKYGDLAQDLAAYRKAAAIGDVASALRAAELAEADGTKIETVLQHYTNAMRDSLAVGDEKNILATIAQIIKFKQKVDLFAKHNDVLEQILRSPFEKLFDSSFAIKHPELIVKLNELANHHVTYNDPELSAKTIAQLHLFIKKYADRLAFKPTMSKVKRVQLAKNYYLPAVYETFLRYTNKSFFRFKKHVRRPLYLSVNLLLLAQNIDAASARYALPAEEVKVMVEKAQKFLDGWADKKVNEHDADWETEVYQHHCLAKWYRDVLAKAQLFKEIVDPAAYLLKALDVPSEEYDMEMIRKFVTEDMKRLLRVKDEWVAEKNQILAPAIVQDFATIKALPEALPSVASNVSPDSLKQAPEEAVTIVPAAIVVPASLKKDSIASVASTPAQVNLTASITSALPQIDLLSSFASASFKADSIASVASTPVQVNSIASVPSMPLQMDLFSSFASVPLQANSTVSVASTPFQVDLLSSYASAFIQTNPIASDASAPLQVEPIRVIKPVEKTVEPRLYPSLDDVSEVSQDIQPLQTIAVSKVAPEITLSAAPEVARTSVYPQFASMSEEKNITRELAQRLDALFDQTSGTSKNILPLSDVQESKQQASKQHDATQADLDDMLSEFLIDLAPTKATDSNTQRRASLNADTFWNSLVVGAAAEIAAEKKASAASISIAGSGATPVSVASSGLGLFKPVVQSQPASDQKKQASDTFSLLTSMTKSAEPTVVRKPEKPKKPKREELLVMAFA